MGALHLAIRVQTDNIFGRQLALIDTGRGDPEITILILDREVAAGEGGHPVIIDALHDDDQLVTRM